MATFKVTWTRVMKFQNGFPRGAHTTVADQLVTFNGHCKHVLLFEKCHCSVERRGRRHLPTNGDVMAMQVFRPFRSDPVSFVEKTTVVA